MQAVIKLKTSIWYIIYCCLYIKDYICAAMIYTFSLLLHVSPVININHIFHV